MNYKQLYQSWLDASEIDEQTKTELFNIATDEKQIEDRFYRELDFGTAGLRGIIGAGTNRINNYTIGRATQAYSNFLNKQTNTKTPKIVIAYDSRRNSDSFAMHAAQILCANNIKVELFKTMHSVPQLSFAINALDCVGGIVITASHNPKEYNGYKVYGQNGAQIGPEIAKEIMAEILNIDTLSKIKTLSTEQAQKNNLLKFVDDSIDEQYYEYILSLSCNKKAFQTQKNFKVVYTPLHGVGLVPVKRVLNDIGLHNLYIVEKQATHDIDFSTVSAPNPEAPDAFNLCIEKAKEVGASICIATDPDSDRLGVCVINPSNSETTLLSGNQIGCLLLDYLLSQKQHEKNKFIVKSIVSTNMANTIAKSYNVQIDEVLTGFRFIGEKIDESVISKKQNFIFGFEESFGFSAGTKVRDKDAICAALLICELAVNLDVEGKTLVDKLNELYKIHGFYGDIVKSINLYGKQGMEKISNIMETLRTTPPKNFGDFNIIAIRDYKTKKRTDILNNTYQNIDLPTSDVLYYELDEGSWVCIRPSGTEPKLKIYINGFDISQAIIDKKLSAIYSEVEKILAI